MFSNLFVFSEIIVGMGFTPEEIKDALLNQKYNEVTATYLLLGLKTEVIHCVHTHTVLLSIFYLIILLVTRFLVYFVLIFSIGIWS